MSTNTVCLMLPRSHGITWPMQQTLVQTRLLAVIVTAVVIVQSTLAVVISYRRSSLVYND
jgi:hypothetical protein